MSMSGKKILVTGGAGFVGSHVCERLAREGAKVISLDNYFTGTKENHVEGVEYRVGHTKDIATHIPEEIDGIYHMGEYARVHTSIEEPSLVLEMNAVGTYAVLEFWKKRGVKLVYTASSTKDDAASKTASGVLGRDLSPYTWTKATNVDLINNFARWYSLPYAITYFFGVYGPRERAWGSYGTVVETFRQNLLKNVQHEVNSPGTQTRAFTHVLDTVEGLITVGEKGVGDGYNICSDDVWTIRDVAEAFGGEIVMKEQTKVSRSAVSSDTAAIRALGWAPQHTLAEYIRQCTQRLS